MLRLASEPLARLSQRQSLLRKSAMLSKIWRTYLHFQKAFLAHPFKPSSLTLKLSNLRRLRFYGIWKAYLHFQNAFLVHPFKLSSFTLELLNLRRPRFSEIWKAYLHFRIAFIVRQFRQWTLSPKPSSPLWPHFSLTGPRQRKLRLRNREGLMRTWRNCLHFQKAGRVHLSRPKLPLLPSTNPSSNGVFQRKPGPLT
jgi:hypothetical protein